MDANQYTAVAEDLTFRLLSLEREVYELSEYCLLHADTNTAEETDKLYRLLGYARQAAEDVQTAIEGMVEAREAMTRVRKDSEPQADE